MLCPNCGASYDVIRWSQLPLSTPVEGSVLRLCPCNSALAVDPFRIRDACTEDLRQVHKELELVRKKLHMWLLNIRSPDLANGYRSKVESCDLLIRALEAQRTELINIRDALAPTTSSR